MTNAVRHFAEKSATWLALGVTLGFALAATAQAQSMGPGMMGGRGGGMMGGYGQGMMGGNGYGTMGGQGGATGGAAPAAPANPAWGGLNAYILSHQLSCMSCHTFAGRGVGPSFTEIAHRFAGRADGEATLAKAISGGSSGQWTGYPAMPGGLATPEEAARLAQLIQALAH